MWAPERHPRRGAAGPGAADGALRSAAHTLRPSTATFDGLTFSALGTDGAPRFDSCGTGWESGIAGLEGDYLATYGPGCRTNDTDSYFSISFDRVVSEAAFTGVSWEGVEGELTALLDGQIVASSTANTFGSTFGWFHVFDVVFDELRWSNPATGSLANWTSVHELRWTYAAVSAPSSLALNGLG